MTSIQVPGLSELHDRHRRVLRRRGRQPRGPAAAELEHPGGGDGRPDRGGGDADRLSRLPGRGELLARRPRHAAPLFLHRHRPQRQARRPDLGRPAVPDPARADARLSRAAEPDRGGRRRGARPACGDDAAARLGRADRRPRHHDRLGADHRRAVRPEQRPRGRHRHGDARARGREPRRRPDRRLPHPPPRPRRT